jgi:putative transposase
MNTREITTEYRLTQWAGLLHERRQSGESISEFCENRGISRNTYFYWQKKLREKAGKELLPMLKETSAQPAVPSGWALCKPGEPEISRYSISIEIGGFHITVEENTNPEQIEKVCRVLKSLC